MYEMKPVTFIKSMPPYNAGEEAGFPASRADELVAAGICAPGHLSAKRAAAAETPATDPQTAPDEGDGMDGTDTAPDENDAGGAAGDPSQDGENQSNDTPPTETADEPAPPTGKRKK